jgi:hypothetical protein
MEASRVAGTETPMEFLAVIEDSPEIRRRPPKRHLSQRGRQSRGLSFSITAWPDR